LSRAAILGALVSGFFSIILFVIGFLKASSSFDQNVAIFYHAMGGAVNYTLLAFIVFIMFAVFWLSWALIVGFLLSGFGAFLALRLKD
jgi:hypothetical protein